MNRGVFGGADRFPSGASTGRGGGFSPRWGVFAAVVAVSAYAGAVGLVTGGLAIGAGAGQLPLGQLPGGVTLAVAVGAPATWLAWLAWRCQAQR